MTDTPFPTPGFLHEPDPDNPGWMKWGFRDPTRFNALLGKMIVRRDEDGKVRMRAFPGRSHSNLGDNVHGGALLGFIDVSLFATSRVYGLIEAGTAVTLDLSTQFIGAARFDEPLDFVSEVLRETKRLIFIRGLAEQDGAIVASYSGTIRKPSR
ncbi:PaaI family thioesterase [Sphingomonas tabacisoli]|uniref:PaaI family thioesterase n=1 Tax=Sphingomonas tabacisoli TaxID=2249466 RepID=A0ABW4I4P2_9SPHN